MKITKSELKQLINEVLLEAEFNPFKQKTGIVLKSPDTRDADAAANAAIAQLNLKQGKKPAISVAKPDEYTIDYEKRMKNLIIRRDLFQNQIKEIDGKLNILGKQMKSMKSAAEQLNFLNNQVKPLMDEKAKILADLKDVYDAMGEAWNEVLKKYKNTLASLKTVKKN